VVGAAVRFNRIEDLRNLDYVVPVQAPAALPETGGLSESKVASFSFNVDKPRKRSLFALESIDTSVCGKRNGDWYETTVKADIQNVAVVDKLAIGRVIMQFVSKRSVLDEDADPVVSTDGCSFEGMRLGSVEATVVVDDEPVKYCGSKTQLADFYRKQTPEYRRANAWRFCSDPNSGEIREYKGYCKWSIVREIRLSGPESELKNISVDGFTIVWDGFGKIILGEYLVKGHHRRLTMVRLAMGSDVEGDGSVGDGESNGQIIP